MSRTPRMGKADTGETRPDPQRSSPSVRRIEADHELVISRFVGRLEKLVPLETRGEKALAKPGKPRGKRP